MQVLHGIDLNNSQIKDLGAPTDPTDAATKAYVDQAVFGAAGGGLSIYDAGDYYVFGVEDDSVDVSMTDNGTFYTLTLV